MNDNHRSGARTGISRHWLDVLEENQVRFMALDPQRDRKLIEQLQTRPDWVEELATEEAIFFVRQPVIQPQ